MTDTSMEVIDRFYRAFAASDGEAMAACYAPEIHFSDPVFPDLHGSEAGAMWRMLTGSARGLQIELLEHRAEEERGSAHWRAHYTFSQTGRPVVNEVQASFRLANGLIVEHHDVFDFHRWARQALGTTGLVLGWTPFLRNKVRRTAAAELARFTASH